MPSEQISTLDELYSAFGGTSALAAAIDTPAGTVAAWKSRGSVPGEYFAAIVEAAERLAIAGVDAALLARLTDRRKT